MARKSFPTTDDPLSTRSSLLSRLHSWEDQEGWNDFFGTYWRLIFSAAIKSGLTARGDNLAGSFYGAMDEIAIYNRPLYASEIQAIFNSSKLVSARVPFVCPDLSGIEPYMKGWWKGEDNAADSVGGNNGLLAGNTTYAPGEVGQSFLFYGNGAAVKLGNPLSLRSQSLTIEGWIKRSSTSDVCLAGGDAGLFNHGYGGYGLGIFSDGRLYLSKIGYDSVATSAYTRITDTNWHYVAVTRDFSNLVTFDVDGVINPADMHYYSSQFTFGNDAAIGARGDNLAGSFDGQIDEMTFYNLSLAPNTLGTIRDAGSAGKCDP